MVEAQRSCHEHQLLLVQIGLCELTPSAAHINARLVHGEHAILIGWTWYPFSTSWNSRTASFVGSRVPCRNVFNCTSCRENTATPTDRGAWGALEALLGRNGRRAVRNATCWDKRIQRVIQQLNGGSLPSRWRCYFFVDINRVWRLWLLLVAAAALGGANGAGCAFEVPTAVPVLQKASHQPKAGRVVGGAEGGGVATV